MGAHRRSQRPRSQASYGPETGTTYLLHFERPYRHARHYVGWTQNLAARLEAHARGRGARLVEVAAKAGIGFTLARTWPESTRDREDLIKHAGGARRYCPECGVTPRDQATPPIPAPDRRPMWMADRDGQWDDGTPIIYDPDQTWEQARAIRAALQIPEPGPAAQAELAALDQLQRQWTSQEDHVGLKDAVARAAGAVHGHRHAREYEAAQAEADRLWAIADELDKQMGRRPGHQYELTAERAARIREQIGEDLARDAQAQRSAEARSHEPELQGAEIDRLTAQFGEPEPAPLFGPRPDGTYAGVIDSDTRAEPGVTDEWDEPSGAAGGARDAEPLQGYPGIEREFTPEEAAEFAAEQEEAWAIADRGNAQEAQRFVDQYGPYAADLYGIEAPGADAVHPPDSPGWEFGDSASRSAPGLQAERLGDELQEHADRAAHLQRLESRANARHAVASAAGDAATAVAAREQAQRLRANRLAAAAEAYDTAAALQEDAAQADEERGWAPLTRAQAAERDPDLAEIFDRAEELAARSAEAEQLAAAAHAELDGYEADTPDHLYGAPECTEADPEGSHFGRRPGDPQDRGEAAPHGTPILELDRELPMGWEREENAGAGHAMSYPEPYRAQPQYQAEAS